MKRCHPMAPQYIFVDLSSKMINNNLESHLPSSCHLRSFENNISSCQEFQSSSSWNSSPFTRHPQKKNDSPTRRHRFHHHLSIKQLGWETLDILVKFEGKRLWGFTCWNFQTWFFHGFWQLHRKKSSLLYYTCFCWSRLCLQFLKKPKEPLLVFFGVGAPYGVYEWMNDPRAIRCCIGPCIYI